ncbi:similar to Saccharomyces cerevisiae YER139C RTR1 CTD phosphatase [Maudiozyma saulgeensis]|uniref:Similar to Saccharomyces cerevisiae YER139C RTR1 CTD phosphatase n=1 Tax=Maudiozyma saulgeensis TaxID=1789683 RepID=A0A1X7R8G2_9SACH|nr:similar to Saccharomyces cerevisiae YER139C RTR1 CTD phosphatase [Kazachstania saulgeensis]
MSSLFDVIQITSNTLNSNDAISNILALISQSYCLDSTTFKCVLALLNLSDYEVLLRERSVKHRCAYPLCSKEISEALSRNHLSNYCGDYHFDCSQFVITQLGQFPRCGIELWKRLLSEEERNPGRMILFEELLQDKVVENDINSLTTDMNIFRLI